MLLWVHLSQLSQIMNEGYTGQRIEQFCKAGCAEGPERPEYQQVPPTLMCNLPIREDDAKLVGKTRLRPYEQGCRGCHLGKRDAIFSSSPNLSTFCLRQSFSLFVLSGKIARQVSSLPVAEGAQGGQKLYAAAPADLVRRDLSSS